jgi:hypothetical protein
MEASLSRSDVAVPIEERSFEDFVTGAVYDFGHMEAEVGTTMAAFVRRMASAFRTAQPRMMKIS